MLLRLILTFVHINYLQVENMNTLLFVGHTEIIIIAIVILLFFGGKRIPELMKGLGKGVKSFKDGINGIEEDLKKENKEDKEDTKKE